MTCCSEGPNANSTMIEPRLCSQTDPCITTTFSTVESSMRRDMPRPTSLPRNVRIPATPISDCSKETCSSHSVGDMCHIPRIPPSPTTYTLPSLNKTLGTTCEQEENMFGMIKLKDNDVCYTSGTIEWVGRKRTYPANSGFKIIHDQFNESHCKKARKFDETYSQLHKTKDCDCTDVLPTVNAIVDHLNALHEAVDLVDLRLNTLEEVMNKK
ncbi:unnamed protein product [Chrysodeixis includens]|uniref:Uncharacterized protein n=1 Tax=Chrysodeixis includens TaxID=689277 RepID=A0A9N8KZZ3_CHRIL|nr:unnamed protein product [Chrysodeixis includens]